jgi:hypothetical protein
MNPTLDGIEFGTTIHVEAWDDPVGEAIGVDPRSAYVEKFWLPFLGPSTTWLLRYLAASLERQPEGCELDVGVTARALGLGERQGRNSPFIRCVARAVDYQMVALRGPTRLGLRRRLPPLSSRLAARLPEPLAREHAGLLARHERAISLDALTVRGRQLALSLLELGESVTEAERQLLRWRFDPALARRCARWAAGQRLQSAHAAPGAGDPATTRDVSEQVGAAP